MYKTTKDIIERCGKHIIDVADQYFDGDFILAGATVTISSSTKYYLKGKRRGFLEGSLMVTGVVAIGTLIVWSVRKRKRTRREN